ncbi:MAG: gamma-glutamyl-gamma-aminobutyrate hydrolase family protein [Acidaminococcaceae bacterium]|nr:gamma-glutamyl-gamma-aminobutyrate hydrolase family protein [Acidaminococcaceae bacterium]
MAISTGTGKKKVFSSHAIDILNHDSLLFGIFGRDRIAGCPSWHHQAIRSVDATRLVVTAAIDNNGIQVIEGVERPDKKFVVGL